MNKSIILAIYQIIVLVLSLAAFIWLFVMDWKIGIAIWLILWGNNIAVKQKK